MTSPWQPKVESRLAARPAMCSSTSLRPRCFSSVRTTSSLKTLPSICQWPAVTLVVTLGTGRALFTVVGTTAQIVDKVIAAMQIVHTIFSAHGIRLNCAKRKTEFMSCWLPKGKVTKSVKNVLARDGGIVFYPGGNLFIRHGLTCKHMGTRITAENKVEAEIVAGAAPSRLCTVKMRTRLLRNIALPRKFKMQAAVICIECVMFHSPAIRESLSRSHLGRLQQERTLIWRLVEDLLNVDTKERKHPHVPDLRLARLRFVPRVLLFAPLQLWALLEHSETMKRSWLSTQSNDLKLHT